MSKIVGNFVGSYSQIGKTFIISDENGVEIAGVVTDKEVIFTANPERDIREGTVAATDDGIVTGSKRIPSYETKRSSRLIRPGMSFSIPLSDGDEYNYTQFQCVIAKRNTSTTDSVEVDKVGIYDVVYPTNSTVALSNITKNDNDKSIDLNIINDTENMYYIHYFTFKEEEL